MEISEIDENSPAFHSHEVKEEPLWETVGRIELVSFCCISCAAFIPALFRKKRAYTPLTSQIEPQALDVPAIENTPEVKLPVPRCSRKEADKVREIFETTAQGGLTLIRAAFRLNTLGNEIDHVHTFGFFLAIPKKEAQEIFRTGNSITTGRVLGGIKKGLSRAFKENQLYPYVDSLAEQMGKEPVAIRRLIRAQAWSKLFGYLFDIPAEQME